jgi:putative transposase
MKRTISLKLNLLQEQYQALERLQEEFSSACNEVVELAQLETCTNRVRLHHASYYRIREQFPQLGAQMACNAIAKVANSYRALLRKKKTTFAKIAFRKNTSIHFDKRTYSLKKGILSLFTLSKRIRVSFQTGPFQEDYLGKGSIREAELIRKGKNWYFQLVLELPDVPSAQNEGVMAVDLGENNLAATSTGKLFGGGTLRSNRDQFLALRRRIQSNGSQKAKQLLRKVSGREKRHVRHVNHEVSKGIIAEALQNDVGLIVMEDLTNIRKRVRGGQRTRTRLHRWSFNQLQTFVEYKAQSVGIDVVYISPAYSSQLCSACQTMGQRHKHRFLCPTCGNQQHSDLNASRNLCRFAASADAATCAVNRTHVAAFSGQ